MCERATWKIIKKEKFIYSYFLCDERHCGKKLPLHIFQQVFLFMKVGLFFQSVVFIKVTVGKLCSLVWPLEVLTWKQSQKSIILNKTFLTNSTSQDSNEFIYFIGTSKLKTVMFLFSKFSYCFSRVGSSML